MSTSIPMLSSVKMRNPRILLVLKRSALDVHLARERMQMKESALPSLMATLPRVGNLTDRHNVHQHAIQVCKVVLEHRRHVQWECLMRDELDTPIRDVDLVVTIGGDGTLLQASHYIDSSIPVIGVNSDPAGPREVDQYLEELDATRSTGHLCAATADTFEQVLDEILEGGSQPSELHRIRTWIDGAEFRFPALNDVLLAHPSPAAVSHCILSVSKEGESDPMVPPIHCRSSGVRICTGAGSTAAMKSAGGYPMPPQSPLLQYMVREPISPHPRFQHYLHGWVRKNEVLNLRWGCSQGGLYFDGSHVFQEIKFGTVIGFSSSAPTLRIYLRPNQRDTN